MVRPGEEAARRQLERERADSEARDPMHIMICIFLEPYACHDMQPPQPGFSRASARAPGERGERATAGGEERERAGAVAAQG
eukprot:327382-Rhodomonas_salina.1